MPIKSAENDSRGDLPLDAGLWPSRSLLPEERQALERAAGYSQAVSAHCDLVIEKERADSLFFINQGWAYRYTTASKGGRQMLALLIPGDICNLESLLFDRPDYGVRALTHAIISAVPVDRALALAMDYPGISKLFTKHAMMQNSILGKWALALGRLSARERLAHLLCELSVRLGTDDGNEIRFEFPLTQEQVGDTLGLTNVHVNRQIQAFRAEGLIALTNRTMTIQNFARLRRISGFDPAYLHIGHDEVGSASKIVQPRLSSSGEAHPSEFGRGEVLVDDHAEALGPPHHS